MCPRSCHIHHDNKLHRLNKTINQLKEEKEKYVKFIKQVHDIHQNISKDELNEILSSFIKENIDI